MSKLIIEKKEFKDYLIINLVKEVSKQKKNIKKSKVIIA